MAAQAAQVLAELDPPMRRCLDLAWESWSAGSIGIGAVVVEEASGAVVSEGRNQVGESSGPPRTLSGTLLAHAEMNALARLPLGPVAHLTLYTSLEPCLLCAGAIGLMRIPRVRFIAPDPLFTGAWDHIATHPGLASRRPEQRGPLAGPASDLARLLPLAFLVFWDVIVIGDYPANDVAMARALLSDTPMLTLAADHAPLVDALQVVIDLGTGRR
jgi:tRNA(Arg) A34 adenosine deaminase TadA